MRGRSAVSLLVGTGGLVVACNAVLGLDETRLAPGEGGNGANAGSSGATSGGEGGSAGGGADGLEAGEAGTSGGTSGSGGSSGDTGGSEGGEAGTSEGKGGSAGGGAGGLEAGEAGTSGGTSGSGGSNGGTGGPEAGEAGTSGGTSGAGGSSGGSGGSNGGTAGGSAGKGGSAGEGGLSCDPGTADCDSDPADCETDLTSSATCGESCADREACDALSAAPCVNGGCSSLWAAWPIPNNTAVDPGAPHPQTYVDNGDGTVTDSVTGLVWQKATSSGTFDSSAAPTYCTDLSLGGHTDWRLPSLIELVSLVDYGLNNPAINVTYFPSTQSSPYWSSTPVAGGSGVVWSVGFEFGETEQDDVENANYVRCVR